MSRQLFRFAAVTVVLCLFSTPAQAQFLKGLKKKLSDTKQSVSESKETVSDARAIRCEMEGVCGQVWKSDQFSPDAYETLAVTVSDGTRRYGDADMLGMARDPFEGALVKNGYLLAASTETSKLQERIGGGQEEWTDERLKQVKDFVSDIDAVLVIDIRQLEMSQCTLEKDGRTLSATGVQVGLSARWLNVDVGDVPWVARHSVKVCEDGGRAAMASALETAASQLASALPARTGS